MRVLRLEITGFGPFHRTQTLDFERAASDGILLIGGRTGAGKSSVLDAISFALYGAVPRYDGDAKRVRSDHCGPDDETSVVLEFEMSGERYRVRRTPDWERPKRRGAGTTTQKGEAELWRFDEAAGEWDGVAARPTDVAAELAPVLALNHDQFLQVILLAQNRFQRFLHAKDSERQALLRTLFASQRFDRIEQDLAARRKTAEQAHGTAESLVAGLLEQAEARVAGVWGDSDGVLDPGADVAEATEPAAVLPLPTGPAARREALGVAAERLRAVATNRQAEADAALAADEAAESELQSARHLLHRQLRLRAARRDELTLDETAEAIAQDRARRDAAERAARVADTVRREAAAMAARSTADDELTVQATALDAAREAAGEHALDGLVEGETQPATVTAEQAHAATGALSALVTREGALALRDAQIEALEAAHTAAEALLAETRERAAQLPTQLAEAEQAEQAALTASAPRAELAAALERAESARAAATRVVAIEAKLEALRGETSAAADRAALALDAYRDLLARRRAGAAGILADELKPGEPCAVCGSTEHPDPASPDAADPATTDADAPDLSEAALAVAEAATDATRDALDRARAAEALAATELATARTEGGGRDAEAAEQLVREAHAAHAAAQAAADELPARQAETARLRAERESADESIRLAAEALAAAAASAQAARAERDAEATTLEKARGTFGSLTARRDAVAALAQALDRHAAATSAATRSAEAEATARQEATAALATHGFATPAEARDAELHEPELAELTDTIKKYDAERQRIDGVLAEPELQDVPADRAPIVAAEARQQLAREHSRAAAKADADATHEADELDELLARVDAQLAESAAGAEALALIRNLAGSVEGKDPNTRRMRLEVFVLAARLEAIIEAANRRLSAMVGGRYTLEHDDSLQARGRQSGLGLRVLDEYTGRPRSTESLSGGETFLASLALALGLADVVTAEAGGITLDTIFIDEGFGSLDPDALGQAMAILDSLREGGRTVALISHVAEMKEQIPARIEVVVDSSGASRIEYDDTGGTDRAPGKDTPS
ncbi:MULTISPECIES: AAA family ATPase [unclassified Leucobacter]|uniref:AAA family ATPase n=1 Tax=unclassified Leucobacter TaxID=2621730 RepID=UPI00165E968B|nr:MULTISPECIES: SMC family ATPase [unclassified Leucobacter]MBC9926473.1 SMC family ATPase [Leucobacter sp. cx-169]